MPRIRSSRRAPGLKESDYDHEIGLVDDDDARDSLAAATSRESPPEVASPDVGGPSTAQTGSHASSSLSVPSGKPSPIERVSEALNASAEAQSPELEPEEQPGRGPSIEIEGEL